MIRWLSRPSLLLVLAATLLVGGAVMVFQARPAPARATPLPVGDDEQEIAWLYPATSGSTWERFVSAIRRAERDQERFPGLQAEVTEATFPRQTTTIPQVALVLPRQGRRLVFRWYKLTSSWKTRDWVEALLQRNPPPLAIVGGSSSDSGRELALHLQQLRNKLSAESQPLLLLTTATADHVLPPGGVEAGNAETPPLALQPPEVSPEAALHRLYPQRTFRYCFSNRQMAAAVTHFIWRQNDLRPDSDPVYLAQWNDDSYSVDLIDGFLQTLREQMARQTVRDWGWVTSCMSNGFPPGLAGGSFPVHRFTSGGFRFELPSVQRIDSSVGDFDAPNRYESKVAGELLDTLEAQPTPQERPLLVVAGQDDPSRRFLRALVRASPELARRFVVATGDAISFNTVYRDRQVAWPIQDLPFALVFFCHRNPVDREAGFRPAGRDEDGGSAASGTEDVLLYADIVESLLEASLPEEGPCGSAGELGRRLLRMRLQEGRLRLGGEGAALFSAEGERQSGTGEHIVCLRPRIRGQRVLPEASIEVWAWRQQEDGKKEWELSCPPLTAYYGAAAEGGADRDAE